MEVSKTIYGWLKQAKEGSLDERKHRMRPGERSLSEKLTLLMKSKGKTPDEQGEWLRSQGLHADNGNPMKGTTLLFTPYLLGVLPSLSFQNRLYHPGTAAQGQGRVDYAVQERGA